MKKMIAAGLMAGVAVFAVPTATASANASGRCPTNYEYNPSTGMCHPIFSTQINGCDTSVGAPIEANLKCWGDDWM